MTSSREKLVRLVTSSLFRLSLSLSLSLFLCVSFCVWVDMLVCLCVCLCLAWVAVHLCRLAVHLSDRYGALEHHLAAPKHLFIETVPRLTFGQPDSSCASVSRKLPLP